MFGIFIKDHDNKPVRQDVKNCIKTLKQLLIKFEVKSVGIIKDLGMLSTAEWRFFIDQINKVCKRMDICIVLFQNNLPVPRVEDRYRLIKEYHESAIGGHKGMTKTYDKLAHGANRETNLLFWVSSYFNIRPRTSFYELDVRRVRTDF